jgi:hypothetical protein
MWHGWGILVGRSEANKQLLKNGHKWADNINVDLKETTLEGMDWIKLAQTEDRWWAPMNSVKNL